MIVEEHGMGFWTGVQLPSSPFEAVETNCRSIAQIEAFRNVVSIVFATNINDVPKRPNQLTFGSIQKWIEGMYGVKVSKSSITQVKNKTYFIMEMRGVEPLSKNPSHVLLLS